MAVDMRLERFAVDTFIRVWLCIDIEKSFLPRPRDYGDEDETDCTEDFISLILSRISLFKETLYLNLNNDYKLYSSNYIDFYYYLRKYMTKYITYPELSIFDKMLMSCAVVAFMGKFCSEHGDFIYRYTGPLAWAMYFEAVSIEEFYAAGGWTELKKYAEAFNARLLFTGDLKVISLSSQNDLATVKQLYEHGKGWYYYSPLIEEFKSRVWGLDGRSTCLKCLPLFDFFRSLIYENDVDVNEFELVEAYLQFFLRSLTNSRLCEVYKSVMAAGDASGGQIELTGIHFKAAYTNELYGRIFLDKNRPDGSEEAKSDPPHSGRCIFCCEDTTKAPTKRSSRCDDSQRVEYLKSVIRGTVSEVEITEATESAAGYKRGSDEAEEKIVLRLFLALGMEPSLSKIKASLKKEFAWLVSGQSATDSMNLLKNQGIEGKSIQKKNKRKKKKFRDI